jgi:hypothetical protein
MREIESDRSGGAARSSHDVLSFLAVRAAVAFGATALLLLGAGASFATDLPLVLTNDSIGMSAMQIDEVQGPDDFKDLDAEGPDAFEAEPEDGGILKLTQEDIDGSSPQQAEAGAEAASEFVSAEETVAEAAEVEAETAETDICPADQATAGVASFEQCVEAAIRGGNGFDESSSVCRSLFPAETAPTS